MILLKFGGTSVGSAERIKEVARLITNNKRKIIVLSAMAGTTNALVEIVEALYSKKNEEANNLINKLQAHYHNVARELFEEENYNVEGKNLVDSHFDYIRTFTQDMFTVHEERAIPSYDKVMSSGYILRVKAEFYYIDII